ncbi:hypothetical protein FEM03_03960 [Phragmitibacter flavus]|uniref:Uncharacterized protein n=1 Tax=Phragmitibacter flavus TaxID=2576071 RepID=A0A5R8KI26_9BACT|nr:hypothetical protein [Phragmitibacter flavus]TLD71890.1 hypothetical protein FEM03_03960 [Phragmitibacter flavus]
MEEYIIEAVPEQNNPPTHTYTSPTPGWYGNLLSYPVQSQSEQHQGESVNLSPKLETLTNGDFFIKSVPIKWNGGPVAVAKNHLEEREIQYTGPGGEQTMTGYFGTAQHGKVRVIWTSEWGGMLDETAKDAWQSRYLVALVDVTEPHDQSGPQTIEYKWVKPLKEFMAQSQPTEIKAPAPFAGMLKSQALVLLPVEVMQPKDGEAQGNLEQTSQIRPCRWLDNDQTGDGSIKLTNFPDKDADRIVVRIPLPHKKGESGLTIKVSTEGGDADFNDDPTEVEMQETTPQSGVFESLPFVVVSDTQDDDAIAGTPGGADNHKNDRTHKGQAGGTLVIESDALGTSKIKVPIKKQTHFFEVTSVILDVPGDDLEIGPAQTKMNSQANWMKQAYRPYGVEVRHTDGGVITIDAANKADIHAILSDYVVNIAGTGPGTDRNTILSDQNVVSKKTDANIVLVYVNASLSGADGDAVGQKQSGTHEGYVLMSLYTLMRLTNTPNLKLYTAAHECGHVHGLEHKYLSSDGAIIDPPQNNLMRDGFTRWGLEPQNAGKSGRRLLREQISSVLDVSSYTQQQPSN